MADIRVLVAAAGAGRRARLPYPKTLFPIQGRSILLRILDLLSPYDSEPTVIVSPAGKDPVSQCLTGAQCAAQLVVQQVARGMGDAILQIQSSPAFGSTEHILLAWGDIPFIQPETVAALVDRHLVQDNDFTFATRHVASAYTIVSRDGSGAVTGVEETRELGITEPQAGERDIGLFIFRKQIVLDMLQKELPGKRGNATGEHGFLYIIGHLARSGYRVEALPIATELDLVSLNSLQDVDGYI